MNIKGVTFHAIGSKAKERTFIAKAAKGVFREPLRVLHEQGMSLDLLRYFDQNNKPTKMIDLYLPIILDKRNPLNRPIKKVSMEVKNEKDAQTLLAKGIAKAMTFMKRDLMSLEELRTKHAPR